MDTLTHCTVSLRGMYSIIIFIHRNALKTGMFSILPKHAFEICTSALIKIQLKGKSKVDQKKSIIE